MERGVELDTSEVKIARKKRVALGFVALVRNPVAKAFFADWCVDAGAGMGSEGCTSGAGFARRSL